MSRQRPASHDQSPGRRPPQAGMVMPIVLILMLIIIVVVIAQLRRGSIDERLAGSLRTNVVADSAVQTILRWCELQVTNAPLQTNAIAAPARDLTNPPPWKVAANWDPANGRTFSFTGVNLPGTSQPACLIERADQELISAISDTGMSVDPGDRSRWMKFRITARVLRDSGGFEYAQSELRLYQD